MQTKKLFSFLVIILFALTTTNLFAQKDKSKRKSPPMEALGAIDGVDVKINYSAPSVKDREIWGRLVPYNKVWRTGANEATTFEVDKDVKVEGKTLKAGRYGLFTIPQENGTWTIIFNSVADQWGAYSYDESKDVLRIEVDAEKSKQVAEMMKFEVSDDGEVVLMWEKMKIPFTVSSN